AIEGRTTSASDLTVQLVNSIPPSILPPDQAADLIQRVVRKLAAADKTPPVISGMPAAGLTRWPPNHKFINVASITASDALSGVASFNVTVISNERSDPNDPDFIITGSGLGPPGSSAAGRPARNRYRSGLHCGGDCHRRGRQRYDIGCHSYSTPRPGALNSSLDHGPHNQGSSATRKAPLSVYPNLSDSA